MSETKDPSTLAALAPLIGAVLAAVITSTATIVGIYIQIHTPGQIRPSNNTQEEHSTKAQSPQTGERGMRAAPGHQDPIAARLLTENSSGQLGELKRALMQQDTRVGALENRLASNQRFFLVLLLAVLLTSLTSIPVFRRFFQINQEAKQQAMRYLQRWQDPEFTHVRKQFSSFMQDRASIEETRGAVISVLNFFEEMSIAVRSRVVDEQILKSFFQSVVVSAYRAVSTHLFEMRAANNPSIFVEFERLAHRWST